MKVLYDHQMYSIQRFGGITRYFTQIINKLPQSIEYDIAVLHSNNEYLKASNIIDLKHFKPYRPMDEMFGGIRFRGKKRILNYLYGEEISKYTTVYETNKAYSIEKLKQQDFDVFHPTYYDDYFLSYIGNKPFVLTIHDMIHELYPEMMLEDSNIVMKRKRNLAKKAAHIIAVSEQTKNDIIKILDVPEKKISVVYHSNSLQRNDMSFSIPDNYILYVGMRQGYKNFYFFIHAVTELLKEDKSLQVLCVGSPFDTLELEYLRKLGVEDRVRTRLVSDEELYHIYKKALLFVFPSYYEGFGIPILEAFNIGCPVLCSRSSCFPEIAKGAAYYFNPKDILEIQNAIRMILDNHEMREKLIVQGKKRVQDFSWEMSAKKTYFIYKNIVSY